MVDAWLVLVVVYSSNYRNSYIIFLEVSNHFFLLGGMSSHAGKNYIVVLQFFIGIFIMTVESRRYAICTNINIIKIKFGCIWDEIIDRKWRFSVLIKFVVNHKIIFIVLIIILKKYLKCTTPLFINIPKKHANIV